MTKLEDILTQKELFIYKWQLGILGDFKKSLMHTVTKADESNLSRLEEGFPMEVSSYRCFAYREGWWQEVEKKVAKWQEDKP